MIRYLPRVLSAEFQCSVCGEGHALVSGGFDLRNNATSSLMNIAIFPVSRRFRHIVSTSSHTRRHRIVRGSARSWIIARSSRVSARVTHALRQAHGGGAASAIMKFIRSMRAKQFLASVHLFCRCLQFCFEAKRVERAETAPAAVLAFISADLPRGTLSDSHVPVLVKVRCLARNKIWPT